MKIKIMSTVLVLLAGIIIGCNSGLIDEGFSEQYRCPNPIIDAKSAAECFNTFFEQELKRIKAERGEVPESLLNIYRTVTEDDIFIHNGQFHIKRKDGSGSPFFIKQGVIMADHG